MRWSNYAGVFIFGRLARPPSLLSAPLIFGRVLVDLMRSPRAPTRREKDASEIYTRYRIVPPKSIKPASGVKRRGSRGSRMGLGGGGEKVTYE